MGEVEIKVQVGNLRYTLLRELSDLDLFVLKFTEILNRMGIKYAVVSGYVAILFGRSRLSEDIHILIERMDYPIFKKLWDESMREFWCIITDDPRNAYYEYLQKSTAVRFALRDHIIPNIEVKFPKTALEEWVLNNSLVAMIGDDEMRISRIEVQIAFKLYLGSEKDIEDAKYLYEFFKEGLDKELLERLITSLNVREAARRYLEWKI